MKVQVPIKWKILNEAQLTEDVKNYLKTHKRLTPVRFGYTVKYAESLEYGTGPLNDYQPTVNDGDYTYKTIYDAIYEWAGKKDGKGSGLPIKDEKERRDFAKKVTDRFFMYGMRPHPYWRPAVNWLLENEQAMFDKGYSLYEIADEALRVSDKCIMDQNLPFSGDLQKSAFVSEIDWREVKDGQEYKDYSEDERNAKFKEVGWI